MSITAAAVWTGTKAFAKGLPREVWYGVAVLVLLAVLRWHWIGAGEDRCQAKHAKAQATADDLQVKREAKRDRTATAIATDSHQAAAKATAKTEESTRAREVRIVEVPVSGACAAPVGLPDLAPAVEAANAARRAPVSGGSYSRRQYRSLAGARATDHRPVGEGDVVVGERDPRDPDAGAPAADG